MLFLLKRKRRLVGIVGGSPAHPEAKTADEQGAIQSFNPAASRMFGYEPEEVIGKHVSMLMPEPDSSRHEGYMRRYLRTGVRRVLGLDRELAGRDERWSPWPPAA